jgi:glycine/D-amino acid oxidase-like deaminating enzyme
MLLTRRSLLASSAGLSALSAGCSQRRGGMSSPPTGASMRPAVLEGANLHPVLVRPEREIRTVVGFRPYRPSGFVVRKEERGSKTLIHNYGHGGGGMTLSWGCAQLAVNLAQPVSGKDCGVVGGGVMGLSTARLLQLHGARVTLYTQELPPHTTSNIAGAQWWPVSVFDPEKRTDAFSSQFLEAARLAYRRFQNLVGPRWGVRWVPNYFLSDEAPRNGWLSGPGSALFDLQVDFRDFGPGEHVFPANYVRRFQTMLIEPATYLDTLLDEVQGAGARIEIRSFRSAEEVLALPHFTLFHCTGLGARALFDDPELIPVKGQLTVLLPQPEVNYNLLTGAHYMFPRTDGILVGGTFERGNATLAPNAEAKATILAAHEGIFEGLRQRQQQL